MEKTREKWKVLERTYSGGGGFLPTDLPVKQVAFYRMVKWAAKYLKENKNTAYLVIYNGDKTAGVFGDPAEYVKNNL